MIVIYATMDTKEPIESKHTDVCVDFAKGSLTEEGCHLYLFTVDLENPRRLHVLERWESNDNLTAHMGTQRSAEFGKWMNDLAEKVTVNKWEVGTDLSDAFRKDSAELMGDSVQK